MHNWIHTEVEHEDYAMGTVLRGRYEKLPTFFGSGYLVLSNGKKSQVSYTRRWWLDRATKTEFEVGEIIGHPTHLRLAYQEREVTLDVGTALRIRILSADFGMAKFVGLRQVSFKLDAEWKEVM